MSNHIFHREPEPNLPPQQRAAYIEVVRTLGPNIFDRIPDHFRLRDSLAEERAAVEDNK